MLGSFARKRTSSTGRCLQRGQLSRPKNARRTAPALGWWQAPRPAWNSYGVIPAFRVAIHAKSGPTASSTSWRAFADKGHYQYAHEQQAKKDHQDSETSSASAKKSKKKKEASLNTALRKFYLRVHPDLFHNHTTQKEVNEKSFQKLMNYLDQFKSDPGIHGPLNIPAAPRGGVSEYRLEFYFLQKSAQAHQAVPPSPAAATAEAVGQARKAKSKPAEAPTAITDATNGEAEAEEGEENDVEELESLTAAEASTAASGPSAAGTGSPKGQSAPIEAPVVEFGHISTELKALTGTEDEFTKERILEATLGNLFKLCGVDSPFTATGFTAIKARWNDEVSLMHFLNRVSERSRNKGQARLVAEREMDIKRTMFHVQHRLRILYDFPSNLYDDWKKRVDTESEVLKHLQTVTKALEDGGHDMEQLHNVVLVMGQRRGIDQLGRLNLHYQDSNDEWLQSFKALDLAQIKLIKENGSKRSDKELEVAQKLGLAYFYSDYSIAGSVSYLKYLDHVVESFGEVMNKWDFSGKGMKELKIRVTDLSNDSSKSDATKEDSGTENLQLEVETCTVQVKIGTPPEELFDFISRKGAYLVVQHRKHAKEAEEKAAYILKVKRKYRLLLFSYEPQLPTRQLYSCCQRLINNFTILGLLLEGVRIRVGYEYDFKDDDGTISIKWDWLP